MAEEFDRRQVIAASSALLLTAAAPASTKTPPEGFVRRAGARMTLNGKPWRFVGANLWYGAYLGSDAAYGNRARLGRELDALVSLGITNVRVLASSEDSLLRNSVHPTFRGPGKAIDPTLLDGLDYLLVELGKRKIKAVLYLTNFWDWSGGMVAYLAYTNGGKFMDFDDPEHPWPAFPDFSAQFYGSLPAVALYHDYVRALVSRTNAISGTRYVDDPTIMAWQLANEPRPGGTDAFGLSNLPAFYRWIAGSARLIKSLDPNHMVCTGSEGLKGALERPEIVRAAHSIAEIDYLTCHVWPLNWSWISARDLPGTHDGGAAKVTVYLNAHSALAADLGKPLVIEEFGYPRDGGGYDPEATTVFRDRFYSQIYAFAEATPSVAGTSFWAWGGEGRAVHGDHHFRQGDTSWLGDPPHEPQGWYSVYDSDASTRALIQTHARTTA